jgi:hypothetical protein
MATSCMDVLFVYDLATFEMQPLELRDSSMRI